MFDANARDAISRIARNIGVEAAALLAVADVESAGKPFAMVNGRPMPLIRWEGHYFYRLLPPDLKNAGVQAGLAHPAAGRIPNPPSQSARYAMLERGKAIHEEAALSSCSWGLGQVMGAHWRTLGYPSVQQFVAVACSGIEGQTEVMSRFISKNGLTRHLKNKDWVAFARSYNGPAYKMNRYDTAMGRAYIRYLNGAPPPEINAPVLVEYTPSLSEYTPAAETQFSMQMGATGPAVRELQEAIRRAGIFVYVDGHFGATTQKALMEYQRRFGIAPDAIVGADTRAQISGAQSDASAPWWSTRSGGTPQAAKQAKPKVWWDGPSKKTPWWGA